MKPSKKFIKMCDVYKIFSKDWENLDYSDKAKSELYKAETYGTCKCNPKNGFYVGKKWLNVFVAMWYEDIEKGLLFKWELYEGDHFPKWWLDKIFN
jgi:hypothetical protein